MSERSAETLRYDVVDVFTDRAYAGNPLAVVHGAEALSTARMQAIATEFNLSETTFPLPPTGDGDGSADYRVRIFTPGRELPFAGHPSVGTAWVLARDGVIGHGERIQECGAGLLPVRVDGTGARVEGGEPFVGEELNAVRLAAAVGLGPDDVDGAAVPGVAGAGVEFAILLVQPDAVARCRPDPAALADATGSATGLLVAAVDATAERVHARMFGNGIGVPEDPATGSAAVALGVFLADRGLVGDDGDHPFVVTQGVEMGRPSTLYAGVRTEGGRVAGTWVGGTVVAVAGGSLTPPPEQG
ncbi:MULTISPECIES: PhzF family phenazine biosynthesis protein [unclassified Pseudonocardia]|uniref:PhzF family phenazine biosynthesis protein n=1 Tax=unclassified Pseudonocardia TaxID=2619320 RepID=UPI0001FFE5C8|nr:MULTISPECIES: PhzF family phenazine biosynthesis protein [unclassified Pseudonocardia]ALE74909.1 phenazine biosynthesis protein PhzF [Pseudonocardia sp. EC080625-04]ALL74246.1 phenazine biosynthesis protein PhzF [Pseudonocardia sp. EC080610-09]ALL81269.1 phenazine biosynthesis protein PhzF [Pseudonocardia sp. EC080619-01]OLM16578.1 Phenazine biosynthesis protein PhzF like [Pseudonocardia sp. Ae707_Ps1]